MDEQFILRVPPSVAERIERLLSENPSSSASEDEDGRSGTFVIGNDLFPASLLELPCMVESYKTYDDNVLIKTSEVGQIIVVREEGDPAPEGIEFKHGLTSSMRDARRRRFRREPDLNPKLVQRVEKDLLSIMAGGTAENVDVEVIEHEEDVDENVREKTATLPPQKPDAPEAVMNGGGEPDRSDTDDSDDSI